MAVKDNTKTEKHNDIVARLRSLYAEWGIGQHGPEILREAADEIIALRRSNSDETRSNSRI